MLLWLFYRRIDVVGADRLPRAGPVVVGANHHNAVVDAMLVVATLAQPVKVLANAPLFRHLLLGPFLRMMGAVPVNRRAEFGDDPRKNDAMFAAAIGALRAGGVILIFPEGRTQPHPVLLPLRTGAARIVLGAESAADGPCGVTLLPVGLVFHDPGTFRSASVLVNVGDAVPTQDLIAAYREAPETAVRTLTARLAEGIRARIVEAEDHYTLGLLSVLEQAWWEEAARRGRAAPKDGIEGGLSWKQEVMRGARHLAARQPQRVAELRRRVELYRARLEEVGLTGEQLGQPYRLAPVLRYVAKNAVWLTLGLPLALWGIACQAVPYAATGRLVRWLGRTEEEAATNKMAVGLVCYPLLWLAETWLVWWFAGTLGLVIFLVLLVPSGLLALAWHEQLVRVGRQVRAFVRSFADRDLHRQLLDERRALIDELRALASLIPPTSQPAPGERAR